MCLPEIIAALVSVLLCYALGVGLEALLSPWHWLAGLGGFCLACALLRLAFHWAWRTIDRITGPRS